MASVTLPVPTTTGALGAAAQTSVLDSDRTFATRADPGSTFAVYVGASSDTSTMVPLRAPGPSGALADVTLTAGQAQRVQDSSDWSALMRLTGTGAGNGVVMSEPAADDGNLDLLQGGNAFGAAYVAGSQDAQPVRLIQAGATFVQNNGTVTTIGRTGANETVAIQSGAGATLTVSSGDDMLTTVTGSYAVQSAGNVTIRSLGGSAELAGDVSTNVAACNILPPVSGGAYARLQSEDGTQYIGIMAPAVVASSVDYILPEGPGASDQGMLYGLTAGGVSVCSFGPAQQGAEYDRTSVGLGGYVQPAVGSTVNVLVGSSAAFHVGQAVFSPGGYYAVTAVPDATHVTIRNNGNAANVAPGATIAAGAQVRALPYGVATLNGSGVFSIVRPQATADAVVLLGLVNGATGPVDYFANAGVGVTLRSAAGAADSGRKVAWEIRQD